MVWLVPVPAFIFPPLVGVLIGREGQTRAVRFAASVATAGVAAITGAIGTFITTPPNNTDRLFNTFAILVMGLIGIPIAYGLFVMGNKFRLRRWTH